MTEAVSDLGSPPCATARDTARVHQLLDLIRRLAVDQPMLERRIGELGALLDEMLG